MYSLHSDELFVYKHVWVGTNTLCHVSTITISHRILLLPKICPVLFFNKGNSNSNSLYPRSFVRVIINSRSRSSDLTIVKQKFIVAVSCHVKSI